MFAFDVLEMPLTGARTVAVTVSTALGLYLTLVLEATGLRRRTIVTYAVAGLAALYLMALEILFVRDFFALAPPGIGIGIVRSAASRCRCSRST